MQGGCRNRETDIPSLDVMVSGMLLDIAYISIIVQISHDQVFITKCISVILSHEVFDLRGGLRHVGGRDVRVHVIGHVDAGMSHD